MKRTSTTFPEGGFGMVAVIAILTVLAVLGASLALVASMQHVSAGLDIQGVRAYHAARGGVEWGLYQILRNGQTCAGVQGQTVTYGNNLTGFAATLSCVSSAHEEGGSTLTLFAITATGCNQASCPAPPAATYVERQLRATVARN